MIAAPKKNHSTAFPRAKIGRIVEGILPKGKSFELRTSDSGIREMKVVRVVTSAWKNLRPPERIEKVLDAMDGQLSPAEEKRILYFSVLTPKEYKAVVLDSPNLLAKPRRSAKRLAVRKETPKKKRTVAK